jgi:hypothetical protein
MRPGSGRGRPALPCSTFWNPTGRGDGILHCAGHRSVTIGRSFIIREALPQTSCGWHMEIPLLLPQSAPNSGRRVRAYVPAVTNAEAPQQS